tara:strand:+ start:347 stop:532 length:186 start_codon:yes stop_codon:yes gene_type:complete
MRTYRLTDDEIMYIAERELPQEAFYQDTELTYDEAIKNLDWLLDNKRISRITYDYYKEGGL